MAKEIIMPKQGLQMTEGTIVRWLKREGERVEVGQPLVEIETDKLTLTIDSTASGAVLTILHGEGDTVPVAEPIALVGEPDGVPVSTGRVLASPRARCLAQQKGIDWKGLPGSGPDGAVVERDVLAAAAGVPDRAGEQAGQATASPAESDSELRATRAARDVARELGVSVSGIRGTGLGGMVAIRDVEAAAPEAAAPATGVPATGAATGEPGDAVQPMTGMRRAIWENMSKSSHEMAHAFHRIRVDMTHAAEVRAQFKAAGEAVSYNDILMLALSRALTAHPALNAHVVGNQIIWKGRVNIGVAVAVKNGLLVPTVRDVQRMNLLAIHAAASKLIEKAQTGALAVSDLTDGTFTLSNLGMYGVDDFVALVNPPQVAILAVGAIADAPVAVAGQVVIRPMVTLTLTYDHRAVDGAPAAEFLRTLKGYLENPYRML